MGQRGSRTPHRHGEGETDPEVLRGTERVWIRFGVCLFFCLFVFAFFWLFLFFRLNLRRPRLLRDSMLNAASPGPPPTTPTELQRRRRAGPRPRSGVYGQTECELRVRGKKGEEKRGEVIMSLPPSPTLRWLFIWTDRLSRSTSCGWNTNGYD